MNRIYDRLTIPEADRLTSIRPEQGEFIFDFIRSHKCNETLETGLAYGCSAAYILSATTGIHIAIDPYQENYGGLGIANLHKLGLFERLRFIDAPSHLALPSLLESGAKIDFGFIDGGHLFDEIFLDWFYIDRLLHTGGYVLFHDLWLPSTQMVAAFIGTNRVEYERLIVACPKMCLFQKVGSDHRSWSHFEPFSRNDGAVTDPILHPIRRM